MKRVLLVAADRALTRFVAEALLEHSVDAPPRSDDEWDVARAHHPLEAEVLVARGGRPFDLVVVDHDLGGADALDLLGKLRALPPASDVPLFLVTERGRDPHVRRIAVERHRVTGFIEKPFTAEGLRETLGGLERKKRVLLAEADDDVAERYAGALTRAGYSVDRAVSGREALDRAPRFRPDAVVASLVLPDVRGVEVCAALKRAHRAGSLPVVLYGQVADLGQTAIDENAHRADDFVQAPFDDDMLVERVAHQVGLGPGQRLRRRRKSVLDRLPAAEIDPEHPTLADLPRVEADEDPTQRGEALTPPPEITEPTADTEPPKIPDTPTPPPSASPPAVSPSRRSTRRVPCHTAMSIRNGEKVYRSRTLDISHGGIFLATDEPLEIGERIDMAFELPGHEEGIHAVGRVCWVGRGGADHREGVGVKFSSIDPADLEAIVGYVNRVARVLYSASE